MKPLSTYRLQLHQGFPFREALSLTPYFEELGVSHLYLSPILMARPGSLHGYDTCDHGTVNPELGGEADFRELALMLRSRGMGVVVDFVPNHMAADSKHNAWWRDVLANGPSSAYASYFDIDWDPVKPELKHKILLPILGGPYGEVLEAGHLRLVWDGSWFRLSYWEHDLPVNPKQIRLVLRFRLEVLERELGPDSPEMREYKSILFQLDHLPAYTEVDPARRLDRRRETEVAQERLSRLAEMCGPVQAHLLHNVTLYNGSPGDSRSFDLLHELLERQVYRLAYWRTALHEINYRRFFDINELAALRMESDEVFEEAHAKLFELIREGLVDGIRLDHLDGLYDPAAYCRRLREVVGPDFYIVAEKILSGNEPLDEQLLVDGTTGYGALNALNRLFVKPENEHKLLRIYSRFTGRSVSYPEEVEAAKRLIITSSLASELNLLAHELNRISESDRRHRDFTLDSLQEALREVVVAFDVYRTYITERDEGEQDRAALDRAIEEAIRRNPALDSSIFLFIRENLRPRRESGEVESAWQRRLRFAMKFQQYTAPVQAKGVEDTAFYRYCPLLSLNEVGGDPTDFGAQAVDEAHRAAATRQERWPHAMVATATHDTKRGEDARARLNVLSEIPEEWQDRLRAWSRINARAKRIVDGQPAPDRNDEYLYYQALLGAWPDGAVAAGAEFTSRMKAYLGKAVKEAKVHTSWVNPSNEYDAAVAGFVEETLMGSGSSRFLHSFLPFAARVAKLGEWNSLSQLVLKCLMPGTPDIYQGAEFPDLSLVDPDNRRPVDFHRRWEALADGSSKKLRWLSSLLQFRRRFPEIVVRGSYEALHAEGPQAGHLFGFLRRHENSWLMVLAVRRSATWIAERRSQPTVVPLPEGAPQQWKSILTSAPADGWNGHSLRPEAEALLDGEPAAALMAQS